MKNSVVRRIVSLTCHSRMGGRILGSYRKWLVLAIAAVALSFASYGGVRTVSAAIDNQTDGFTISLGEPADSEIVSIEWVGGVGGNAWSEPRNWKIGSDEAQSAPRSSDRVVFSGDSPVTVVVDAAAVAASISFTGSAPVTFANPNAATTNTLTVGSIESTGADVTNVFNCAVAFTNSYDVDLAGPVNFAGGVASSGPATAMADRNETSHLLLGVHTWTADWTAPKQTRPFIVPEGSSLHGLAFTGNSTDATESSNPDGLALRILEGGYAEFDSVTTGAKRMRLSVWGTLKVNGIISSEESVDADSHIGYTGDEYHPGVIIAGGVHKTGHRKVYVLVPELYVGADGLGATVQDWFMDLSGTNHAVHFTADSEVKGVRKDNDLADWGLYLSKDLECDTDGHTVVWKAGILGSGAIIKTGAGRLVMTPYGSRDNRNVTVDVGTLVISNQVNFTETGAITVKNGATLEIADGVISPCNISFEAGSSLTLEAGAKLNGSVALPEEGTVQISAAPGVLITSGIASADKFTLAPGCQGTLCVVGGALVLSESAANFVWTGDAGDGKFSTPGNWSVGGDAATEAPGADCAVLFANSVAMSVVLDADKTVSSVMLTGEGAVTFANPDATTTNTLTVGSVQSSKESATHVFNCAVAFTGTYDVDLMGAVDFAGGATATAPGTVGGAAGKRLTGNLTFTQDWTITESGWVIAAGSALSAGNLTGAGDTVGRNNVDLRIEEGAVAHFASVAAGRDKLHISVQGEIDVDGDYTTQCIRYANDDTTYRGYIGYSGDENYDGSTVRAGGVYRTLDQAVIDNKGYSGPVQVYPAVFYIGSGGFGTKIKDYTVELVGCDKTFHATDDFEIFGVSNGSDWGLTLSKNLTIDTAGHVVTWRAGIIGNGAIVKTGAGTLVMNPYGSSNNRNVTVEAGTLVISNQVNFTGNGKITVKSGATLEIADGLKYSGAITLEAGSTIVFGNGAQLTGTLTLPDEGTVLISGRLGTLIPSGVTDVGKFAKVPGCHGILSVADGALSLGTETFVWTGAAQDDDSYSTPGNWDVGGAAAPYAPAMNDAVIFNGDSPVTVVVDVDAAAASISFKGSAPVTFANPDAATTNTITVVSIESTVADVTNVFNCAVAFTGSYDVNLAGPVDFAGGVASTGPATAMAERNETSHLLLGVHKWTADWSAPKQTWPFIVPEGSSLYGQAFTGSSTAATESSNPDGLALRILEGGYAEFDSVKTGADRMRLSVWGTLKVNGIISGSEAIGYNGDENHFGKIIASGVHKVGSVKVYVLVPELYVGADGLGATVQDWFMDLSGTNHAVHFTADSEVKGVRKDNDPADWGLYLSKDIECDTDGHTVVWKAGILGSGAIIKTGSGTLVMTPYGSRDNRNVTVEAGTLVISNQVNFTGTGTITVKSGATLEIADGVVSPCTISIEDGAILKFGTGTSFSNVVTLPETFEDIKFDFAGRVDSGVLFATSLSEVPSNLTVLLAEGSPKQLSVRNGMFVLGSLYRWVGGVDGNFSTLGNWRYSSDVVPVAPPGAGDVVHFAAPAGGNVTNDIDNLSVCDMAFPSGAGAFTLEGKSISGVYRVANASSYAQTISNEFVFVDKYLVDFDYPVEFGNVTATIPDDTVINSAKEATRTLHGTHVWSRTAEWTHPACTSLDRGIVVAGDAELTINCKLQTPQDNNLFAFRIEVGGLVRAKEDICIRNRSGKTVFKVDGDLIMDKWLYMNDYGGTGFGSPDGGHDTIGGGTVRVSCICHMTDLTPTALAVRRVELANSNNGFGIVIQKRDKYYSDFYFADGVTIASLSADLAITNTTANCWYRMYGTVMFEADEDRTVHLGTMFAEQTAGAGRIVKTGAGTLDFCMGNLNAEHSSYYSGGTEVRAGTARVSKTNSIGVGLVDVKDGATLEIAKDASIFNNVTLREGATLAIDVEGRTADSAALTGSGELSIEGRATFRPTGDFTGITAETVIPVAKLASGSSADSLSIDASGLQLPVRYSAVLRASDGTLELRMREKRGGTVMMIR